MVAVLGRVPLERINRQAATRGEFRVGPMLLALLAGFFYGIGWLVRKTVHLVLGGIAAVLWAVGFSARWVAAAVAVGWQDASAPRGGS